MKVLLINPPIENIINLELPLWVRQNQGVFPPLGLMYLASYLKKNLDCEVRILDALAEKMNYGRINEYIRDFHPNVVGITAHTNNLIDVILTTDIIKKIDRNIHVCLGGPHVNIFPKETIALSSVDSVVLGEGEITFADLVKCLKENVDLEIVKGLIFKQNGLTVNTGVRENIADLNILHLEKGLLNPKRYYSILGQKSIMTTMISSRGCPYRCIFCSTPKGNYRMRLPKNVVDEMGEYVKLGVEEVYFVDDTFNADHDRVIQICEEIKRRRLKIKWSFRGRIDKITMPLLIKSKEAGCYRIHLGVETSTNEGLERLRKGGTIEQIRQVFKWTRHIGINTLAYFLIGCPHEKSREDVIKTINFSKEIDPDFALFNILTPYPSSELYEIGLTRGVLKKDFWREFVLKPQRDFQLQFWQEWLSRKELINLLNLAYRKFYLRPKFLFRMLTTSQNLAIFARRLKTGLEILRYLRRIHE